MRPTLPARRSGQARRVRIAVAAAAALGVAAALSGCSSASEDDLLAEAQAVAEEYLAAIADQDQETADAMTEASELEVTDVDETVDVRAALPGAAEPITEVWLQFLGQEETGSGTNVTFEVSYLIGDAPGAKWIELWHADGDPADAWTVTEGLLVYSDVFADREAVPSFTFGGVELQSTETSNVSIWGYPGAYLTEAVETEQGVTVEPVSVVLGAEVTPPWNDSLPMLEGVSDGD